MTFAKWLEAQVDRDDLVGDVARDARMDSWPKPSNSLKAWKNHLAAGGACREAHEALDEAWNEYQNART